MFYNYLIFSKVTLSLRICLKYLVSLFETFRFSVRNKWFHGMKQTTACGVTPSMLWDD